MYASHLNSDRNTGGDNKDDLAIRHVSGTQPVPVGLEIKYYGIGVPRKPFGPLGTRLEKYIGIAIEYIRNTSEIGAFFLLLKDK